MHYASLKKIVQGTVGAMFVGRQITNVYSLQCYTANCHASCVTHFACRLKALIACMKAKSLTSDSQIQFIIYIVLNR